MNRFRLATLSPLLYLCIGLVLLASGTPWEMTPPFVGDAFDSPWWHLIPLALASGALVLQRRRVMAGFGVASVAALVDVGLGLNVSVFLVWADAAYSVARRAEPRQRRLAIGLSALAAVVLWAVATGRPGGNQYAVSLALNLTAGLTIPFWWGAEVRTGDDRAARADAATQLERERSEAARREAERDRAVAVQRERGAMASDLHDVVSAHLSSIALHSAAALSGPPDAELDRRALQQTRTASLAALDEMRIMIGLLHQPGEPLDLLVRDALDALPALVQQNRDAGLDLEAQLESVVVTPVRGQALLRVAQEGLANAAKHGTGSATVRLVAGPEAVLLDIENPTSAGHRSDSRFGSRPGSRSGHSLGNDTGHSGSPRENPREDQQVIVRAGPGMGLFSMTERMRAVGGALAVTHDGDRWRVQAEVPVPAAQGGNA